MRRSPSAMRVWLLGASIGLFAAWAVWRAVDSTPRGLDRRAEAPTVVEAPSVLPSVLLVTIDTLRPDHLSCYGYSRRTSPNLDAIAARGVLFEVARSQAPLTAPAHASIFTGRLPSWNRVLTNGDILDDGAETLAERLSALGLRTAAFISNPTITSVVNFDQGFEHYDETMPRREANRVQTERLATATVDAAMAWLEQNRGDRFFVWLHLQDPHGPYIPPEEHARPFLAEARERPAQLLPALFDQSGRGGIPQYSVLGDERNRYVYEAMYDGEIHYMDSELGRLFDRLEAWRLRPFTVITADHGEALGEHGYFFAHGHQLTEDQIRVPLILHGPGAPEGQRVKEPAEHRDIVPTILRRLGQPVPQELPGRDLLDGSTAPGAAVAQAMWNKASVVQGNYKLMTRRGERTLYDLAKDPAEDRDVIGEEPKTAAELAAILKSEMGRARSPWRRRTARAELLRHQLEALGYVE